jgi:S-adenosylmethionine decarboxylase
VGFGPHLVVRGQGASASRLQDLDALYRLLEDFPDRIHMTRIMPPYVFRHRTARGRVTGLSGFVLIAESHISIHTFSERHMVEADVFSCASFDVEAVLTELRNAFHPQRVQWKLLDRGLEFPRDLAGSRALVEQRRRQRVAGLGLEVPG